MRDRAAIYARQSVTKEGSASLQDQVAACRGAAERLGFDVVVELTEKPSTSGFKQRGRARPMFKELLERIRTRQVDCVIAYKTDRLSRGGGPGWAPLLDAFEGVSRDLDHAVATPGGWVSEFEIGMRATMDREESKKTSDRMRMVREREAREGKPRPSAQRPYGYSADCTEIIPEEAERISEGAERVLAGESVWAIAKDWNRKGVPSTNGGKWSVGVLLGVLRSGRVAGLREHHGAVTALGEWPAIITPETHEELRTILDTPRRQRRSPRSSHPLSGVLRCGLCGHSLSWLARGDGTGSYSCRKGPGFRGCGGIRIKAAPLERHVRDLVFGTLLDPETRSRLEALTSTENETRDPIGDEIRKLDAKRTKLLELYLEDHWSKAELDRQRRDIDDQLAVYQTQLHDRTHNRALTGLPATEAELDDIWHDRGADFQRALITAIFEPIVVNKGTAGRKGLDESRLEITYRA